MRIQLDSGKEVKVSDFCFGYVYEGMLCGTLDEKSNRAIFDKITISTNWGEAKGCALPQQLIPNPELSFQKPRACPIRVIELMIYLFT